jgi:DNA helicase-2/ATP-dependent DNA helicase PcrA
MNNEQRATGNIQFLFTGEIVKVDKVTQTYEIQFENIRGTRRLMFRAELGNVEN